MNWILRRAARIIVAPDQEWQNVRTEAPRPLAAMLFISVLSLIPAGGWTLGLWLFGNMTGVGPAAAISGGRIAAGGVLASGGMIMWVVLSAVSMTALARLFSGERGSGRALQVAAYSATPVAVAGLLLIHPDLLSVLIIAYFHSLYLQYSGVQRVLHVKAGEAAEYVALSTLLLSVLSTLAGALGGWLGVL